MPEYKVQLNAKVGDHLINVNGETAQEALEHLGYLAENVDQLHYYLSTLDGGRPATEIVQKEKQWGARSQGGRSYQNRGPKDNRNPGQIPGSPGPAGPAGSGPNHPRPEQPQPPQQYGGPEWYDPNQSGWSQPQQNADQLIQQQLGGQVISQTQNAFPPCPQHGLNLQYFQGGTNKAGKQYSDRWACPERGCSTIHWHNKDGGWS